MPTDREILEAHSAVIEVPEYDPHELLSITDIMHLFGLSRSTIERMRRPRTIVINGVKTEIPPQLNSIKILGSVRFPRAEVQRLLNRGKGGAR